jgi:hypothetical protein
MRKGVTRWILRQCTASMSTMRSRMTGMLPIGSTSMTPAGVVPASPSPSSAPWLTTSPGAGSFHPAPCIRAAASSRCVLQASPGLPFIRTPHEPQIAC